MRFSLPFRKKEYLIFIPRRGGRYFIGKVKAKDAGEAYRKSMPLLEEAVSKVSELQCYRYVLVIGEEGEVRFPNPFFTEDEDVCPKTEKKSKEADVLEKIAAKVYGDVLAKTLESAIDVSTKILTSAIGAASSAAMKIASSLNQLQPQQQQQQMMPEPSLDKLALAILASLAEKAMEKKGVKLVKKGQEEKKEGEKK